MTEPRHELDCFIISAFGHKPLIMDKEMHADFDDRCDEIRGVVQAYEETHPEVTLKIRRADDFTGGVITHDFYRQLYGADIVIAEVSSLNLNVYYELGVRLALRRNVTIMLAIKGTPLPFDLQEVRAVFYEPGKLAVDNASEIHRLMEHRLAGEEDSPVYRAIHDLHYVRKEELDELNRRMRVLRGIEEREDYGLRIEKPEDNAEVGEWFDVSGAYTELPPRGSARLFNRSPLDAGYWPQSIVEFDTAAKTWRGEFHLGADPPEEGQIVLAVVGESTRILWDYYWKVGEETGEWPPIEELPEDVFVCDERRVTKPGPLH